jgi:thiol-disulfide isomerase/thioredoxin
MRIIKFPLIVMLILLCSTAQAQVNIFLNEHPEPGQKLTIRYNTAATKMYGIDDFKVYAYLLGATLPIIQELELKKEGQYFIGNITTTDSTKAVIVKIEKDDLQDDNNGYGFGTLLYKGGKPVQGAQLALAKGFYGHHYITGVKRKDEADLLFRKEFTSYPGSKQKYRNDYLMWLRESKEEADKKLLKNELQKIVQNPKATEEELSEAKFNYDRAFKDTIQTKQIDQLIKKKYPNGNWQVNSRINAFYGTADLEKRDSIYNVLLKLPAPKGEMQNTYDYLASNLARAYVQKSNVEKALHYSASIKDKSIRASLYNSMAWKMSGEGINGTPDDIGKGKELSEMSMSLIKEEMQNIQKKPAYLTDMQWKEQLERSYHSYADTYAVLLFHEKKFDQALELQKKAVTFYKNKNINLNYNYAAMMEKVKGPKEAAALLEIYVLEGYSNQKMVDQLKNIYLSQNNNDDAAWTAYYAGLEKKGLERMKEELARKMINLPAPSFTLKDLKGNPVSLASLKGKVVVVDFWATWCGPCIASFPGMQKAVNKYKDNPDVAFVFIDTWESGENREKQVTSFIEKNKYTFNVLYDETMKDSPDEFAVVTDFKVDGIPTKFVLDQNNTIRFKSVGYNGNPDALVNEISLMIELADINNPKTGNQNQKKAF